MGLNERHFDIVMKHLVATLEEMNFETRQITHAQNTLLPLRNVFKRIAKQHQQQQRQQQFTIISAVIGLVVAVGTTMIILKRRRTH